MKQSHSIKKIVKRGLQYFSARYGPQTWQHTSNQLLILMYHRILPENDSRSANEEPGMKVTPETFKQNLLTISKSFTFISLSEWINRKNNNLPLPQKACVITFDDGWADNYEFAFPILKELSVPATVYIVANMIGTHKMFWPERLALIAKHISLNNPDYWFKPEMQWIRKTETNYTFSNILPSPEQITQIISDSKRLTDENINELLDKAEHQLKLGVLSQKASLLSWEQIKKMTNSGLVELGSHTCNHIRLNQNTSPNALENEIVKSKTYIEDRTGLPITTFCFPNGDYSENALALVRKHYQSTVTTSHGWNSLHSDTHTLRRIGIHEDIANDNTSFLARISGWI